MEKHGKRAWWMKRGLAAERRGEFEEGKSVTLLGGGKGRAMVEV